MPNPPQRKSPRPGPGKDFKFPDYYPSSNGVRQLKTLVTEVKRTS